MSRSIFVALFSVFLTFSIFSGRVQAAPSIGHTIEVGHNLNSGRVVGWFSDDNAVITNITSGVSFSVRSDGQPIAFAWVYLIGVYGTPSNWGSYHDLLANSGIGTDFFANLDEYSHCGVVYVTDDWVQVGADGHFNLHSPPNRSFMIGFSDVEFSGVGAVPVNAWSSHVVAYQPWMSGSPTTWQASFTSEWLVTGQFTARPVPVPSTLGLVAGSVGILALRRRR